MIVKPKKLAEAEAGMRAALKRALVIRRALSTPRKQHGLPDKLAFVTAAEFREMERDHADTMRALRAMRREETTDNRRRR